MGSTSRLLRKDGFVVDQWSGHAILLRWSQVSVEHAEVAAAGIGCGLTPALLQDLALDLEQAGLDQQSPRSRQSSEVSLATRWRSTAVRGS